MKLSDALRFLKAVEVIKDIVASKPQDKAEALLPDHFTSIYKVICEIQRDNGLLQESEEESLES